MVMDKKCISKCNRKPAGKKPLRRPRRKLEDNITVRIKEKGGPK
jgi:hypothetical protein